MECLILLLLIFILVIYLGIYTHSNFRNLKNHSNHSHHNKHLNKNKNQEIATEKPCRTDLNDREYLLHMIPHHQVAVDISLLLQKTSKSPKMQEIFRQLIWTQRYEIKMMEEMLEVLPNDMSGPAKMKKNYINTISDFIPPNKLGLTKTYCDPHFFDPEAHMKHMEHMELDDKMYLEHMIPHHQVAVDMSKKLLKNTENDFMIYLAYRIIRSQQEEIIMLQDLLNPRNIFYQSNNILF